MCLGDDVQVRGIKI